MTCGVCGEATEAGAKENVGIGTSGAAVNPRSRCASCGKWCAEPGTLICPHCGGPTTKSVVLAEVRGGCVEITETPGVTVVSVDWDNAEVEGALDLAQQAQQEALSVIEKISAGQKALPPMSDDACKAMVERLAAMFEGGLNDEQVFWRIKDEITGSDLVATIRDLIETPEMRAASMPFAPGSDSSGSVKSSVKLFEPGPKRYYGRELNSIQDETFWGERGSNRTAGEMSDVLNFGSNTFTVMGRTYCVGETSQDDADWSEARRQGLEFPPNKPLRVGRLYERAAGMVAGGIYGETGFTVVGGENDLVKIHAKNGDLLAVYDPRERSSASIVGDGLCSPEEVAAIMAYFAFGDREGGHIANSLRDDLFELRRGERSAIACADGMSLLIQARHEDLLDDSIRMGGKLNLVSCLRCGAKILPGDTCTKCTWEQNKNREI